METNTNNLPFIYKYRPLRIKDFYLDDELKEIIAVLIRMDNLNISLIGDAGTGKTALITSIINEYYYDNPHPDFAYLSLSKKKQLVSDNVLTINSLKDQGIHFYRNDVKLFCQTKSSMPNRKKIVILDDIDTINDQSQQVFRNCLDKYQNNVHFISSCVNIQKVLDSLQSRQTIVKLKHIEKENMEKILVNVSKKEGIEIENDAIPFVLSLCNHSVRVLLNYLEKFKLLDCPITFDLADSVCTSISYKLFAEYTTYVKNKDLNQAIHVLYSIFDKGYSVIDIFDNYYSFVKMSDLFREEKKYEVIKLLCKYITIFYNVHEDEMELALFTNNLMQCLLTVKE
jgi:replication factor C subunit 2/4